MRRFLSLAILGMLVACEKKDEDVLALGLIVANPSHRVVVWVNGEPVKVCLPGGGGVVPLRMVAAEGENQTWVTIEKDPGGEASVTVEIKEGSWAEPEDIKEHFSWESGAETGESPKFSFKQGARLGSDRSKLQAITLSQAEAVDIARERHAVMEKALVANEPASIGLDRETLNAYMEKMMGIDDFYGKVFGAEGYACESLCRAEDLEVVKGERTILAYNSNGGNIFTAGPEGQPETGELKYSFFVDSIAIGRSSAGWVFLH